MKEDIRGYFTELYLNKDDSFANARTVRNFFEKAVKKQANRISTISNPSDEELIKLTKEDLF